MTQDIATLGLRVDARQVRDGDRALDDFQRRGAQAERQVDRTNAAMQRMARMAATVAAALGANEIIRQADLWASLQGRLSLVTNNTRELAQAQEALFDLAQRTRVQLEPTVDLYAKMSRAVQTLNKTDTERLRVTESVNKALTIGGGAMAGNAAALVQLAQGFGANRLGGEELNSILEQTPRLAQAIAEGMGRNVGDLKGLAEQGKLTAEVVFNALQSQAAKLDAEFERMPKTVGQAMTQIQNAMLRTIGVFDQTNQLSAGLAEVLSTVAANMGILTAAAAGLAATMAVKWVVGMVEALYAKVVATNAAIAADRARAAAILVLANTQVAETAATLATTTARLAEVRAATLAATGNVQLALTTNALIPAQQRATAAALAHAAALNVQRAAGAGAAGVAGWGARAMGLLGGPIGIITTLLGIGATAWMMWGSSAKKGSEEAKKSQADASKEIIAGLDKDIARLTERNRLMGFAPALAKAQTPAAERMREITAEIDRIEKSTVITRNEKIRQTNVLGREFSILAEKTKKVAEEQEKLDKKLNGDKRANWLKANSQYLTDEEKLTAALTAAQAELGDAYTKADEARIRASFGKADTKKGAEAIKQAQDFIKTLQDEQTAIGATESQLRMLRAAKEAAEAPTAALRLRIIEEAVALDKATLAWEEKTAAEKRAADAKKVLDDGVEAIWNQVRALQAEAEGYGKTAEAMVQAQIKKVEAQLLSAELSEEETRALQMQLAGLQALSTAQAKLTGLKGATSEPQKLLDVMEALDDAAKSAGANMQEAFGSVGSAIGDLTSALTGYARTQAAISKQLAEDEKAAGGDKIKLDKARSSAALQSAQAQMRSYGDMARAAKGFFKENSAGYRAMEGAEKAYRAFEMALAVKSMLEKSGLVQAFTALFVGSKATETAATVASVGPDVAASQVKGQAAAAAGVAGQAQGDPYSAWARMAAMAAVMAGLGFMVSGGSKPDTTAKDRQAAAGTGSVFGDASAKSQSIKRAIELSANNSSTQLNYTAAMLRSLLAIQSSLSGLGNLLLRDPGISGDLPADQLGAASKLGATLSSGVFAGPLGALADKIFGGKISSFTGKVVNAIFGGNVSTLDGGLTADKTSVGGIMAGSLRASSYIDTKKDGGWFRSDKYSTQLTALDDEANAQLTLVLRDMVGGVKEAGKLLGFEGAEYNRNLDAFTIDLGKISSKDQTAEEFQAQLEAVFSKVGDDMARWAVAGLAPFQKVGEGYLETLVRVASNYANLDAVLNSVGMTFGAVGLASIAAREDFIASAGGMDALASKYASFADNYLTQEQRLAPVRKYVTDQLTAMNLAHLDSREAFAAHLSTLNPAIEGERRQIVALLDLQEAFAATHAATVDLSKSEQEIADERADLQSRYDDATLTAAEKIAKERAKLDPSNRELFDRVRAAEAARDAQDAARDSLQSLADGYRSFADDLRKSSASLLTGSLSPLTQEEQYAELRRQYEKTAAAALAGDTAAQKDYGGIRDAFLTASQKRNGGDSTYSADFAAVLDMNDKLAAFATDKADTALATLAAAERQANGIDALNATMLAVAQYAATVAGATAPTSSTPLAMGGYGAPNTEPLIAEIKALRSEVAGLRADNATLAAQSAQAGNRGQLAAADKIVEGVGAAVRERPRATERALS